MKISQGFVARWGKYIVFQIIFFIVLTAAGLYVRSHSVLCLLTFRGAVVFWSESAHYEDLMNAAAYRKSREAIVELNSCSQPTVASFACAHPEFVRHGVRIGELERQEDAYPPPPPQPAAQVAQP